MIEFIQDRGEAASAIVVVLALIGAGGAVAALLGVPRRRLSDLWWYGGLSFVIVGRLAFVARGDADSLTDPLVVMRVADGVEPLWGAAAALAVGGFIAMRAAGGVSPPAARRALAPAVAPAVTMIAAGLLVSMLAYDLACPLRDACYGRTAPSPLGFRMAALADTRLATSLWEAAALSALLGGLLRSWHELRPGVLAAALLGLLAAVRLVFTPLAVSGWPGWGGEPLVLALVVAAAAISIVVLVRHSPATGQSSPMGQMGRGSG